MAKLNIFLSYIMYGKKFYRRRPRKYLRRRKTTGKRRSTVSSRIRRYVKTAIHRQIENKQRVMYSANNSVLVGDAPSMTWPLINSVLQGTNAESRTGNQIKITRGIGRFAVNLLPYDATTNTSPNPCWVKIWVVRDLKNTGQLNTMDTTSFAAFFRYGGGYTPFQNNVLDTLADVNNENFRVLMTRTFKLGQTANFSTTPTAGASYLDNSPMAKHFNINWGKYCKKALKFQDNAYYPMNENLYFVIHAVPCDGRTVATTQKLVEFHYVNHMEYEDA